MKAIERAGGNRRDERAQESLSDFGLASAGSLYGSVDDLGAMSDVTSDTESAMAYNARRDSGRGPRQAPERGHAVPGQHQHPREVQLVREPRGGETVMRGVDARGRLHDAR